MVRLWVVKESKAWISARYDHVSSLSRSFTYPSSKEFNARTANMEVGTPIPVRVTVRPDRSFHFETRTPTTTWLLFQAAGVTPRKNRLRGSMRPGHEIIGEVSLKHVYNIAQVKQSEVRLAGLSLEGLCKSVIASAHSIGVRVVP